MNVVRLLHLPLKCPILQSFQLICRRVSLFTVKFGFISLLFWVCNRILTNFGAWFNEYCEKFTLVTKVSQWTRFTFIPIDLLSVTLIFVKFGFISFIRLTKCWLILVFTWWILWGYCNYYTNLLTNSFCSFSFMSLVFLCLVLNLDSSSIFRVRNQILISIRALLNEYCEVITTITQMSQWTSFTSSVSCLPSITVWFVHFSLLFWVCRPVAVTNTSCKLRHSSTLCNKRKIRTRTTFVDTCG